MADFSKRDQNAPRAYPTVKYATYDVPKPSCCSLAKDPSYMLVNAVLISNGVK